MAITEDLKGKALETLSKDFKVLLKDAKRLESLVFDELEVMDKDAAKDLFRPYPDAVKSIGSDLTQLSGILSDAGLYSLYFDLIKGADGEIQIDDDEEYDDEEDDDDFDDYDDLAENPDLSQIELTKDWGD